MKYPEDFIRSLIYIHGFKRISLRGLPAIDHIVGENKIKSFDTAIYVPEVVIKQPEKKDIDNIREALKGKTILETYNLEILLELRKIPVVDLIHKWGASIYEGCDPIKGREVQSNYFYSLVVGIGKFKSEFVPYLIVPEYSLSYENFPILHEDKYLWIEFGKNTRREIRSHLEKLVSEHPYVPLIERIRPVRALMSLVGK